MVETHLDLSYSDIMKMSDEVGSPDGPGSSSWDGEGVHTKRVNAVMARGCAKIRASWPAISMVLPC